LPNNVGNNTILPIHYVPQKIRLLTDLLCVLIIHSLSDSLVTTFKTNDLQQMKGILHVAAEMTDMIKRHHSFTKKSLSMKTSTILY